MKFTLTVTKTMSKRLSEDQLRDQLTFIGDSAKRSATNKWNVVIPKKLVREVEINSGETRQIQYSAVITLTKNRYKSEDAVQRKFIKTRQIMERAARRKDWQIISDEALVPGNSGEYIVVNGAGEPTGDPAPRLSSQVTIVPPKPSHFMMEGAVIPALDASVMQRHFSRIYDRDAHIRIIHDNLRVAIKTGFKTRHHLLLKGPPACAKTEMFLSFIDWLGEDLIEAIDGGTMTKAGLEHLLLQKAQAGTLKPILLLEEIEKCHPENVACLIQVMDARGKIQRVNANTVRDGDGTAECKIIVWGTCNDEDELKKFHKGAIWSRFSNKMDCERPDRNLMRKILLREVEEINGKEEWVDPVLAFCFEELANIPRFKDDYDDPRVVRAMLVGGDRLLDGSYFSDYRKTNKIKNHQA